MSKPIYFINALVLVGASRRILRNVYTKATKPEDVNIDALRGNFKDLRLFFVEKIEGTNVHIVEYYYSVHECFVSLHESIIDINSDEEVMAKLRLKLKNINLHVAQHLIDPILIGTTNN